MNEIDHRKRVEETVPQARKLKSNQRGPWCQYCPPKTTRAKYRSYMFSAYACTKCADKLPPDPVEDYSDAAFNLPKYI